MASARIWKSKPPRPNFFLKVFFYYFHTSIDTEPITDNSESPHSHRIHFIERGTTYACLPCSCRVVHQGGASFFVTLVLSKWVHIVYLFPTISDQTFRNMMEFLWEGPKTPVWTTYPSDFLRAGQPPPFHHLLSSRSFLKYTMLSLFWSPLFYQNVIRDLWPSTWSQEFCLVQLDRKSLPMRR